MEHGNRRHGRDATRVSPASGLVATPVSVRLVATVALVAAAALAFSTAGAPPASAGALDDADRGSATASVIRIAQIDVAMNAAQLALPAAEAAAAAAPAAAQAAREAERRVHASGPPAPDGTSTGVVNAASSAILGELAPEQATATRAAAEQAVIATAAHRDQIRGALAAASAERGRILADLEQFGQRTRWSIALLDLLGAPVTVENVRGLAAWIGAESNNSRFNNPLATTMGASGATDANSVGVKSYPNDAIGLDATVRTLHNGLYQPIIAALVKGDSAQRVVLAVAASPWGTGINAVRRLHLDG